MLIRLGVAGVAVPPIWQGNFITFIICTIRWCIFEKEIYENQNFIEQAVPNA